MNANSSVLSSNVRIYLLLTAVILIWGLSWPINKLALQYASPLWFSALRLIVGTSAMFVTLALSGKLFLPNQKDIPPIILMGLLQIGLFMMFILSGLRYVNAGRSAILAYSTPIWVAPIAIFIFKEKLNALKFIGLLLGISGIFALFGPWEFDWLDQNTLIGNGLLILAAICWASAMLYNRFTTWNSSPLALIPWQLLVASLLVITIAYISDPHPSINWAPPFIANLAYSGILATGVCYWGVVEISKVLSPITASLCLLAVPVFGLISATLWLGEPLTPTIIVAMCLIVAGLACLALSGKKVTTPPVARNVHFWPALREK